MRAKHVIAVFVYMLILFIVIALFASKYADREEIPEEYSDIVVQTEVPTSGYEVNLSNKTEPIEEPEREFYPPPDIEPDFLKGLIINPDEEYTLLDIKQAQLDGANLLVIELYHNLDVNETPSIINVDWKPKTLNIINEAHKNGMLVELRLTSKRGNRFLGPSEGEYYNYLSKSKKFFKELGDFAQEYKIYRFTVYTQANDEYQWETYNSYIGNVSQEILLATKHYYKGDVGIGFTYRSIVTDKLNPNIDGYDYVVIGRYPTGKETEVSIATYVPEVREAVERGRSLARGHGILNVTLGFFGLNTEQSPAFYTSITASELEERDFYEAIINEFEPKVEAITINYITEMYGINEHTAEYKVQQMFHEL